LIVCADAYPAAPMDNSAAAANVEIALLFFIALSSHALSESLIAD
jgi:hypothetical protein